MKDLFFTRARAGADFLTLNFPGWLDRIRMDTLDVNNVFSCPLAQASGKPYTLAVLSLQLSELQQVRLGFYVSAKQMDAHIVLLAIAWKKVVKQLQAAAAYKLQRSSV